MNDTKRNSETSPEAGNGNYEPRAVPGVLPTRQRSHAPPHPCVWLSQQREAISTATGALPWHYRTCPARRGTSLRFHRSCKAYSNMSAPAVLEGKVSSMSAPGPFFLLQSPKDHRNHTMYSLATRSFWPEAACAASEFMCLCIICPNTHIRSELGLNRFHLLSCPGRAWLCLLPKCFDQSVLLKTLGKCKMGACRGKYSNCRAREDLIPFSL